MNVSNCNIFIISLITLKNCFLNETYIFTVYFFRNFLNIGTLGFKNLGQGETNDSKKF